MLIYLILAPISGAEDAPFVITLEDAATVDHEVDLRSCGLEKSNYSRYYWYEGAAKGDLYIIDLAKVRFAVVDDDKRRLSAVVYPPFDKSKYKFKAIGLYQIGSGVVNLECE